jgi:hypothetical protein
MLYNRHSLLAVYLWMRWALLRAQPWRSVLTRDDRLDLVRLPWVPVIGSWVAALAGDRFGWFLTIECTRN